MLIHNFELAICIIIKLICYSSIYFGILLETGHYFPINPVILI